MSKSKTPGERGGRGSEPNDKSSASGDSKLRRRKLGVGKRRAQATAGTLAAVAAGLALGPEALSAIRSELSQANPSADDAAGVGAAAGPRESSLADDARASTDPAGAAPAEPVAATDEAAHEEAAAHPEGALVPEVPAQAEDAVLLADARDAMDVRSDENLQIAQAAQAQPKGEKPAASSSGESGGGEAAGGESVSGFAGAIAVGVLGLGLAGGGGGGGGGAVAAVAGPGGFAAKGVLNGATVFYDLNGNGLLDGGEPSTLTNAQGLFTFTSLPAVGAAKLVVTGGTYKNKLGEDVAFTGKMIAPAGVAAITPFSTLKAGGLSDAALEAILGKPFSQLTASDLDAENPATAATEAKALALFELIETYAGAGDSAAKLEAIAAAIAKTIQAGIDAGIDLTDPGAFEGLIELAEAAAASVAAAPGGDFASALLGVDADLLASGPKFAKIAFGADRGAVAEFDANGNFLHYSITEANLGILQGFGADPFGADDLYLEVQGTLLGTDGAPITFAQLNALGVDRVLADSLAPYLRIGAGVADQGATFDFDPNGADNGVVSGTELNPTQEGYFSGLGVTTDVDANTLAGYIGSGGWTDPLDQD